MESGEPSSVQGPPMDTPDNDTYQQLLEQIKVMNKNLEAASFAINNLTMQFSGQITATNILPQISNGNQEKNGQAGRYADTSDPGGDEATHVLGYVNWDDCCEELEDICLVKIIYIRDALAKLQNMESLAVASSDQQIATRGQVRETQKTGNGLFVFKHSVPVIGKEDRFPQDAVYIDVNSPKIKEEMDFMNKILVRPTQGVFDRFLKIVESEKMTCATFEKKYGLKWV